MIPPAPYWAKDFAVVKKDGVYHLFYIERNTTLPQAETERDFGHAVSYDLIHWTQAPPILAVRDSSWDNMHVWAPSIVEHNGVYTMFYAGVTSQPDVYRAYQRIGIATSTDLYNWTREDQPLFSCDQVPWAFCDSLDALTSMRDPYVMPDPTTPGRWLMYYTANAAGDSLNELIGVAQSDSTLRNWTDLKPLWNTFHSYTGAGLAESPHVFQHDGLWYLFYTSSGAQPIVMTTSPDPTADPDGWTPRGRMGDMLGINTGAWFASEYLRDGLKDYLFYVDGDRIEYYQMVWNGVAKFQLLQPDPFHVTGMAWEEDTVRAGTPAHLRIASVNWFMRHADIETVVLDSLGNETVVPTDSLGLASTIPMSDDTLHWVWNARSWPAGRTDPMRLRVRLVDQTAMTPIPIVVLPDTSSPTPPDSFRVLSVAWGADSVARGKPVVLEVAAISGAQHSVGLTAFTTDGEGSLVPAPLDSLGLPPILPLDADTTRFTWTSRTWPDSVNGPQLTRLVVRIANDSLETRPWLDVLPDSAASDPGSPGITGSPDPGDQIGELIKIMPRGARNTDLEFAIHLTRDSPVRLELFDVQGRRAATPLDGAARRGWSRISWNGRREDGGRAGPGIYFARLTTPRGRHTTRVVLLP
jgi:predicted GH43/DUF377 family glycosyl hydrolase